MSRVRIPPVLRDVVGGSRELVANGTSVAAVLDDLFASHPALRDRLSEEGRLSSFVNVYVNDTDIRHGDGLDTHVGPGDIVIILPAMAGGCCPPLDSPARVLTMRRAFELKHKSKLQRSCREARA